MLLTLGMADKETIGDLVQSLLGYYNLRVVWDRTLQGPLADTCEDFIRALELACFARWAAGYAAPTTCWLNQMLLVQGVIPQVRNASAACICIWRTVIALLRHRELTQYVRR